MNSDPGLIRLYANIGSIITSSLRMDDILSGIMEEIKVFFGPENWSLLRLDEASGELFFVVSHGSVAGVLNEFRLKPGEGIAGKVASDGVAILVRDALHDPRVAHRFDRITGFETRSIVAVPIKFNGRVFGVIELVNRLDRGVFSETDMVILETIARFAAIAFANAATYEETRKIGYTDPLTLAFNKAKLREIVTFWESEKGRRSHEHGKITVFLIDLDDFKLINDNFGHAKGDHVLKEFAGMLRNTVRSEDMVFRIGGDEFLILVFTSDKAIIKGVEQRIEDGLNVLNETLGVEFGASIGYATGRPSALNQLIADADRVMYEAKRR